MVKNNWCIPRLFNYLSTIFGKNFRIIDAVDCASGRAERKEYHKPGFLKDLTKSWNGISGLFDVASLEYSSSDFGY